MNTDPRVETLDLNFNGKPGIIAVYLVRHANGALLVDCGPGSTLPTLLDALADHNLSAADITDVLLTHIHLDHAGAAGWWAQQGARIHAHPVGAPHLRQPEKLLASAQRIYGAEMERLWGAFLPVPPDRLREVADNETLAIGGCRLTALATPGHAEHHHAYALQNLCFSGDVGGVRLKPLAHVRPPTPPPEIDFGKWRASIARLRAARFEFIAPTHFGIYPDAPRHWDALARAIDAIETWTAVEMTHAPTREQFRAAFGRLLDELARADGYSPADVARYGDAAGADMSADGVYRYWTQLRASAAQANTP